MMDFTGYMKAANIYFFALCFYMAIVKEKKLPVVLFSIIGLFFFSRQIIQRIHPNVVSLHELKNDNKKSSNSYSQEIPNSTNCLTDFSYKITVIEEEALARKSSIDDLIKKLFKIPSVKILKVSLTNNSTQTWQIATGVGAINLSYHWLTRELNPAVKYDGFRTTINQPIRMGETLIQKMAILYPFDHNNLSLKISPVQEGCAWFYLK